MNTFAETKTYAIFAGSAHRKLIEKIEKTGSKVFVFAPPEAVKTEFAENAEIVLQSLAQSDWLVFTDVFAVSFFLEILESAAVDLFELDEIRVVACGEAIADRLRFVQLHADIITNSEETGIVFSAILNYVGKNEIADTGFLIFKEKEFSSALREKLSESKANVSEFPIYQMRSNDKKEIAKLKTLLKGGAIDEFVFTSPEDVVFIKKYLQTEVLSEIFCETTISATNEITLQTLTQNNLKARRI